MRDFKTDKHDGEHRDLIEGFVLKGRPPGSRVRRNAPSPKSMFQCRPVRVNDA
jgi:hypothetical protein